MAELTVANGYLNYSLDNPISIPLNLLGYCKITKCPNDDHPYVALEGTQPIDTHSEQSEVRIYPTLTYTDLDAIVSFLQDNIPVTLNDIYTLLLGMGYVQNGTPVNAAKNTATFTIASGGGVLTNNKTLILGGKTYTFKTALTPAEGEVLIEVSDTLTFGNLTQAINHGTGNGTKYSCAAANAIWLSKGTTATILTLEAIVAGIINNSPTLAGNTVGTWHSNDIGVNGTIGSINTLYFNGTNLYLTTGNTISQANWRYIASSTF